MNSAEEVRKHVRMSLLSSRPLSTRGGQPVNLLRNSRLDKLTCLEIQQTKAELSCAVMALALPTRFEKNIGHGSHRRQHRSLREQPMLLAPVE